MLKVLINRVKRLAASSNVIYRWLYRQLCSGKLVLRLFINARFRSEILTRSQHKDLHYQGATHTINNRFPILFKQCEHYLQHVNSPRILSFGCSTGEEVFSLAQYLPDAEIVGVDINKWCLKQCIKKNGSPKINFVYRLSQAFNRLKDFDAIFCMAVFQRTENRENNLQVIMDGFSFEKFEDEILLLDKKLKVGGLFFIDQCDFNFADTVIAAKYVPLEFNDNKRWRERPLYDRNNLVIAKKHNIYRAFVKKEL